LTTAVPSILALNVGSATIRYALFEADDSLRELQRGKLDDAASGVLGRQLLDRLEQPLTFANIKAIGHRLVHGMAHTQPERITEELMGELRNRVAMAPIHLPRELDLIAEVQRRYPTLPQLACFDTAFHRTLPRVAKMLAIPRQRQAGGVERYGFHGLSYAWLLQELQRSGDLAATQGRVVMAHLGGGASMAAILRGQCIDTSMGFTPNAGLMMGTRSGDLDPGLMAYLIETEHMTMAEFNQMVSQESGLLGVSGTSSDMRELLSREHYDVRAAEAVDLFCYQARKCVGAYAAVLGGMDTLVFSGGIGENAPQVRSRICANLAYLGVEIDESRNTANAAVISPDLCRVSVRVIRTDEERMIAQAVRKYTA
jgi:acetate kinase